MNQVGLMQRKLREIISRTFGPQDLAPYPLGRSTARGGCQGFTGPIPPPFLMSVMLNNLHISGQGSRVGLENRGDRERKWSYLEVGRQGGLNIEMEALVLLALSIY
jgi:hypothetical protein